MKPELSRDIPPAENIYAFRDKITLWFRSNGRDYPWRKTRDPFRLLMAEMMLRRTKADQVKTVYERLFAEYPDVKAVAGAEEEKLEQILLPLGLRWRIPAFAITAKRLRDDYRCKVPETRGKLTELQGVGDYVAGAVLSIAYGQREWIVDSNIVRLFRRYFGISTSKEGRRDKHVIEMAKIYASAEDPKEANLAILDFAALVCMPRVPDCSKCPLGESCHYRHPQLLSCSED